MRRLLLFLVAVPLWPQDALSLRDAVQLGLRENQSIAASEAAIKAADAQVSVAKSGLLPKLNYTESVTRGNNPVYVFGSLLTQHQFSEQNFACGYPEPAWLPGQLSVAGRPGATYL